MNFKRAATKRLVGLLVLTLVALCAPSANARTNARPGRAHTTRHEPAVRLVAGRAQTHGDAQDAERYIRKALADWVAANNRKDYKSADDIWAADVVGWFPSAEEFSPEAAFAVAGLPVKKGTAYSTYELKIEEIDASSSFAAVHDVWTETRHFDGSGVTARRVIRGSELWRRQPDGNWKIARFVSAPEKWERAGN